MIADARPGRIRASFIVLVALALGITAGWWAARATVVESAEAVAEPAGTAGVWSAAQHTSVGRTVPVSITVRQDVVLAAENTLPGVVTSVLGADAEATDGGVLYTVGDRAVRAVAAERPFWRDLAVGARGDDVAALQRTLVALGHLGRADGTYGPATDRAVRAWQRDLGQPQTGSVPVGEVVALPTLPSAVEFGELIQPGRTLSGGEEAVLAPTGEREFVIQASESQARVIPTDATITLPFEGHTWEAIIARTTDLPETGSVEFDLVAPDGGVVCGEQCDVLPHDPTFSILGQAVVVPPAQGLGVPAAAVLSRSDLSTYVLTRAGERDVRVVGSGQGIVVLEGIDEGTEVQVLAPVDGTESPTGA